jgi:hypothetical protein
MNRILVIYWHDKTMEPSTMKFDPDLRCANDGKIGSYFDMADPDRTNFGGKPVEKIGTCTDCLKQGEEEQVSIRWIQWDLFGIIGGKTFKDGKKSIIYACQDCGMLVEKNKPWNDHRVKEHNVPESERMAFGFAEPQEWRELNLDEKYFIREAVQE